MPNTTSASRGYRASAEQTMATAFTTAVLHVEKCGNSGLVCASLGTCEQRNFALDFALSLRTLERLSLQFARLFQRVTCGICVSMAHPCGQTGLAAAC